MVWNGYTGRHNLKHSRSDHLFQGRLKSIVVEDDHYLLRLEILQQRQVKGESDAKELSDEVASQNHYTSTYALSSYSDL